MFEAPIGGHRCAKGPQCGTSKYKDQSYLYLGTFVWRIRHSITTRAGQEQSLHRWRLCEAHTIEQDLGGHRTYPLSTQSLHNPTKPFILIQQPSSSLKLRTTGSPCPLLVRTRETQRKSCGVGTHRTYPTDLIPIHFPARQRISVFDGHLIKGTIVLDQSKGTIFLFDKENRRCHW